MNAPYRVLVTGSRGWRDVAEVHRQLAHYLAFVESCKRPLKVVHGDCRTGADAQAHKWVQDMKARGRLVDAEAHPAQNHPTEDFGSWPGCGPKRNQFMVATGIHLCLAFIGPCTSPRCLRTDIHPSHGASGCANLAERAGITTRRFTL